MFRLISRYGVLTIAIAAMLVSSRACAEDQHHEFEVRNATTAIMIAKAALEQEFGEAALSRLKHFEAFLKGDHWVVSGHPYGPGKIPPHGGSFDLVIAVKRGCVLDISVEM
jgi:hypothetical protein